MVLKMGQRFLFDRPPNSYQLSREEEKLRLFVGRTKSGKNMGLQIIYGSQERQSYPFVTDGQVRDYIVARSLLCLLRGVEWMLCNLGYDAYKFRDTLRNISDNRLNVRTLAAKDNYELRHASPQMAQADRDQDRQTRIGGASQSTPIRQMPKGLSVQTCARCNYLLSNLDFKP